MVLTPCAAHQGDTLGNSSVQPKMKKLTKDSKKFEQILIDNGIYIHNLEQLPANWNEIQRAISQPRTPESPSEFSDGAFRAFRRAHIYAATKAMVTRATWPTLIGKSKINFAMDIQFGNLKPLIDLVVPNPDLYNEQRLADVNPLAVAKPDFYDGLDPSQIVPRRREELAAYIVPSAHGRAPVLPNFFAEIKSTSGSGEAAKRQACYDGTLGARGIQKFRTFGAEGVGMLYDNKAYTITSTYHRGMLRLYTIHPSSSNDPEKPVYYMTQLGSFNVLDNQGFQQGANALRNARDWARTQRDELLAAANCRAVSIPRVVHTANTSTNLVSQSAGEPPHDQSVSSLYRESLSSLHRESLSSLHRESVSSLYRDMSEFLLTRMASHYDLLTADLSVLQSQLSSAERSLSSSQNSRSSLYRDMSQLLTRMAFYHELRSADLLALQNQLSSAQGSLSSSQNGRSALYRDMSQLLTRMASHYDLLSADLSALQSRLSSAQGSLSSSQNGRSSLRNRLSSSESRRSSRSPPYRIPTRKHSHHSGKGSPVSSATSGLVNDGILPQPTINEVVSGPEVLPQSEVASEQTFTNSSQPSRRSRAPSTRRQSSRNSRFSPHRRPTPHRQSSRIATQHPPQAK
ncbi:hypothetical protein MMC07_006658 [Pseudocyphellaria aurata]|nr:hypothetical protein [Pseudocyphellaria aurata]